MGLSFLGPSRDQPWVDVVRVTALSAEPTRESMRLTLDEIDALHAHIHQDDPKPKVEDKLPPWCPSFDALQGAKGLIRRIAQEADDRLDMGTLFEHDVLDWAQGAHDLLGGGPVLRDDLDLDDDPESESSAAEDAEAEQKRAER